MFDEAFARIELIQRLLSFHAVDSELSQLNRAEGQALVCHPLTLDCLRLARAVSRASAGVFNAAMGGQLIAKGALPGQDYKERYGAALQPVGRWQDLTLTPHGAPAPRRACLFGWHRQRALRWMQRLASFKRRG